jgi:hypothetical protein
VYLLENSFFKKINLRKVNYFSMFDSIMKNKLKKHFLIFSYVMKNKLENNLLIFFSSLLKE